MSARAFYAEFDDLKGPAVAFDARPAACAWQRIYTRATDICKTADANSQAPARYFESGEGRRIWETFSDYVITGVAQLDGCVVQVRTGNHSVLCARRRGACPRERERERERERGARTFEQYSHVRGCVWITLWTRARERVSGRCPLCCGTTPSTVGTRCSSRSASSSASNESDRLNEFRVEC